VREARGVERTLGLPPLFAITYAAGCFDGYSIAAAAAIDREGVEGIGDWMGKNMLGLVGQREETGTHRPPNGSQHRPTDSQRQR
jgi:hypothetical protein